MIWNELMTWDVEAAKAFYGALFGWTFETGDSGYTYIFNGGRANGGMLQMDASFGETPAHWRAAFNCADLAAALAQVEAAGGSILISRRPIPDVGDFAFVSDPLGAAFLHFRGASPTTVGRSRGGRWCCGICDIFATEGSELNRVHLDGLTTET